jgi:hypothetical protein
VPIPSQEFELHRIYKFKAKDVVVTHEWTAADGHTLIDGHYVEGRIPFACPKLAFLEAAELEA